MNISLPDALKSFVDEHVGAGGADRAYAFGVNVLAPGGAAMTSELIFN